jgi:diaminopimelate epimerase
MQLTFVKYHGTGNDFIFLDNRSGNILLDTGKIKKLCDRHFGVGADGIILLTAHTDHSFEMHYFNSDGSAATFCGNGGRCAVAFARSLGMFETEGAFLAADGVHHARILLDDKVESTIQLQMKDPDVIETGEGYCYLNTGTWHYVEFVNSIENMDVDKQGREIRWMKKFAPHGTNVNFVGYQEHTLIVRTFEKGVEGETLSCGTGVTASAVSASILYGGTSFLVKTAGGDLKVDFNRNGPVFSEVFLTGPATRVYEGILNL